MSSIARCLAKEMAELEEDNNNNNTNNSSTNNQDDELNSTSGCETSFDLSNQSPNNRSMENLMKLDENEFNTPPSINHLNPTNSGNYSPPYKRVRALRLFDSPLTPKTILQKCSNNHLTPLPRSRLFPTEKPRSLPCAYGRHDNKPTANVNPFTPTGMMLTKKRTRSPNYHHHNTTKLILNDSDDLLLEKQNFDEQIADNDDDCVQQPTKRVALQENNISRYHQEFHEIELIGCGQFGSVYKCINRLDGCIYAIKKSIKPVAGSQSEKRALNEVYAHAVLGKHQHVVRYYSAWAEDNHMIIQNEYCNGGSLAERLKLLKHLNETELKILLQHVTEGLRYIHSEGLVHLDIKPDNIFISKEKPLNYDSCGDDNSFDGDYIENDLIDDCITYKIGDLGHVTSINNPQHLEEGDSRYLANEVLHEDYTNLIKADIFALGITMLEASGYQPIPKNGDDWHQLRLGKFNEQQLPQKLSRDLIDLIQLMLHPEPIQRPTTIQILNHTYLQPIGKKTKAQLHCELNAEKLKNEILSKQLQEVAKCIKQIPSTITTNNNNGSVKQLKSLSRVNRLIGKKVNRSISTTTF